MIYLYYSKTELIVWIILSAVESDIRFSRINADDEVSVTRGLKAFVYIFFVKKSF